MMTKSLHTVTSVSKLAMFLSQIHGDSDAADLTAEALTVLGYPHSVGSLNSAINAGDATLAACLTKVTKLLGSK